MTRMLFLIICVCISISSCSSDDDGSDVSGTLTGKIRGVDFTFGGSRFGDVFDTGWDIFIYNDGPSLVEPCDLNLGDVWIDINARQSMDRVELNATGISTGENTISFIDPDRSGISRHLIVDRTGYYRVLEETQSTLTVEMDVRYDDDNFLKGTFVADRCF